MRGRRVIDGFDFERVGRIEPERDEGGEIAEEMPQSRYRNTAKLPLNNYGGGPFCRFRVARGWRQGGVYVIASGLTPAYVGECQCLEDRFGSNGYGGISPRNCFRGGQETNCRINTLILEAAKDGADLTLWFHATGAGKAGRVGIEAHLKDALHPAWNR